MKYLVAEYILHDLLDSFYQTPFGEFEKLSEPYQSICCDLGAVARADFRWAVHLFPQQNIFFEVYRKSSNYCWCAPDSFNSKRGNRHGVSGRHTGLGQRRSRGG